MKALAAALVLLLGSPGLALAQASTENRAAQAGDAARLAGLLIPEAKIPALIGVGFRQAFGASLAANPAVKARYDAHPGMQAFVADRLAAEIGRLAMADLPSLREQLVQVIRDEMEPEEIADTITFFESPTGMKMRARANAALLEKGATSAEEGQKTAVQAAVADLAPEDYPAITAFGTSPAARKMPQVNAKVTEVSRVWGTELGKANGPALAAARSAAEAEFLAKEKAK